MKSQIQRFIIISLIIFAKYLFAQPKLSAELGLGMYGPEMKGFDENPEVFFPTKNIFTRNLLLNWGVYYEFFNNARFGYNSFTSFEAGKLDLEVSKPAFQRAIRYRMVPVETFFRWRPRIELNFTLTPIWGRAKITMDTKPSDKFEDWNELLNSFGDSNPLTELGGTDQMVNNWFGYSGMIGARFYLSSRLGVDFKFGFMNNKYKQNEWYVQRNKVKGPAMKIDKLPIFSLRTVFGVK
tara:strand:+ start:449 stop:1162 length:714 start_codon:yes stop_codon:yes gene_type:complete